MKSVKVDGGEWLMITNHSESEKYLLEMFEGNKYLVDDLIEKQRPNLRIEGNYDIIVMSFPESDHNIFQITFIVGKDRLISISKKENVVLDEVFDSFNKKQNSSKNITCVLSLIIDALLDKSITYLDVIESKIENEEIKLKNKVFKNQRFVSDAKDLKEKLFLTSRLMRGNVDVSSDLLESIAKNVQSKYFNRHIEDRLLYAVDYLEFLEETVDNSINAYLALLSADLNINIYRLTIIGSLLIIPTIISGFFGMNVSLPALEFWEIVIVTLVLSAVTWFLIRK